MMRTIVFTLFVLCLCSISEGDASKPVGAYEALEFTGNFKIDGKLDEPGWRYLTPQKRFYAFGTSGRGPAPAVSPLKTAFYCGYTDDGLLLGIKCFDDNMSKLREHILSRDDGAMWRDDCVEIYFSSLPRRDLSFRKFIVNSLGTKYDGIAPSGGSLDDSWNDCEWQADTRKYADRWVLEMFFPWKSIGKKRRPQKIALGLCRFAWSSGTFQGNSWGPGMGFPFIERAGTICFGRSFLTEIKKTAAEFNHIFGASWYVESDTGIIKYTDKKTAIDDACQLFLDEKNTTSFLISLLKEVKLKKSLQNKIAAITLNKKQIGLFIKQNDYGGAKFIISKRLKEIKKINYETQIQLLLEKRN